MNEWLATLIGQAIREGFSGQIELNMFKGGIANVNVKESLKPPLRWKGSLAVKNWAEEVDPNAGRVI